MSNNIKDKLADQTDDLNTEKPINDKLDNETIDKPEDQTNCDKPDDQTIQDLIDQCIKNRDLVQCICGERVDNLENCFGCQKSGCEECLNMVCCDCGVYLCEKCEDDDDIWCGCYGSCSSCGEDVDRGGDGWPCSKCEQWLCEKCRPTKKCWYCDRHFFD